MTEQLKVSIGSTACIEHSSELYDQLRWQQSADNHPGEVDLTNTKQIDVTFVQVLLAAKKEWQQHGSSLRLVGDLMGEVALVFFDLGFTHEPFNDIKKLDRALERFVVNK